MDDPLDFTDKHVKAATDEWGLSLVGYSIGRRSFYESLLYAIRKTWKLKGMMQLLSLSDGFFMLKFTSPEDYDMALNGGVWFFLGKPFVLQKWVPNFKPKREEFSSIPIWLKILDLPLPCWTPDGISRIASKIGVPLAVDNLTAKKTRLTYARVCVQVTKDCLYPDSIQISILGEPFTIQIQYEWKPIPCEHCSSIVHPSELCPSQPRTATITTLENAQGRSTSRRPHRSYTRHPNFKTQQIASNKQPTTMPKSTSKFSPSTSQVIKSPDPVSALSPVIEMPPITSNSDINPNQIPNLNSPTEVSSSSCSDIALLNIGNTKKSSDNIISPNKFDALHEASSDKQLMSSNDTTSENVSTVPPPSTQKASRSKHAKKAPAHHQKN